MQTQTAEPEVLSLSDDPPARDMALMPRADGLAIWESFSAQLAKLKATADTLKVTSVLDTHAMAIARETRLAIRQVRIAAEKKKTELKEDILREGKRIDSGYNSILALCKPMEERLADMEQFAALEAGRIEDENRAKRMAECFPFLVGPVATDLGKMDEPAYQSFLSDIKELHGVRVAREKRERDEAAAREAARLAEENRVREDNARLKAEAEAKRKEEQERADAALAETFRKNELQRSRVSIMRTFLADAARFDWTSFSDDDFATRAQEEKARYDEGIAEQERARQREADLAAEREQLKREAEARDAAIRAEREAERRATEESARKEREAAQAREDAITRAAEEKRQADLAEQQRKSAAAAAVAEANRQELARKNAVAERARKEAEAKALALAKEKRERETAEAAARKEQEAAAKRAAAAPDMDKLRAFADAVLALPFPSLSDGAQAVSMLVAEKRAAFARWIITQSESLTQ